MSQGPSVDIGYSTVADRLSLTLRTARGSTRLWLTRRLVKGFLIRFAEMLERTVAAEAGSARAAVSFEHLEACGDTPDDSGQSGASGREAGARQELSGSALVTEINVTARRGGFLFTLTDADDQAHNLTVSRAEAHRLASAIYRKAQAGGWDLEAQVGWLAECEAARGYAQLSPAAGH